MDTYSYRPKDPRAKLREVVAKYVQSMRLAGRIPNIGVVFGEAADDGGRAQARGYLVEDHRTGRRYILLEDGDVLCDPPREAWLGGPDDELVTLLAKSLADARFGGTGWLADVESGADLESVPDRRQGFRPHEGPERRG